MNSRSYSARTSNHPFHSSCSQISCDCHIWIRHKTDCQIECFQPAPDHGRHLPGHEKGSEFGRIQSFDSINECWCSYPRLRVDTPQLRGSVLITVPDFPQ